MLKNRDTASNPYRVPPQPTPVWIKVSILLLFLTNIVLIGVVSFLTMTRQDCVVTCSQEASSKAVVQKPMTNKEIQLTEAAKSAEQQAVWSRLTGLDETVNDLRERLEDVKRKCENSFVDLEISELEVTSKVAEMEQLTPTQVNNIREIPRLKDQLKTLELKIGNVPMKNSPSTACPLKHYRYGLYCYAIDETQATQQKASSLCKELYGTYATLAMIKNQFEFDFIIGKFPELTHSYWIGVDSFSNRSAYNYLDGSQVRRDDWSKWYDGFTRRNGARNGKSCVSTSYNSKRSKWLWNESSCNERMNYVCQYFIFS